MGLLIHKPCQVTVIVPEDSGIFELYDSTGKLYFFRDTSDGNEFDFNITHAGEYISNIENEVLSIHSIPIPVLPKLDKPTRNRWQKTEIIVDHNLKDTPAYIISKKGIIVVAPIFLDMPKQIQEFLLFHEKAHMLYLDESSCDKFALAASLKKGNNRSMCFYSLSHYLSRDSENIKRMEVLLNSIQETQDQPLLWT